MPALRKHGTATQLIVDGKPYLILGGELGNSSASNMEYMRTKWATLKALHLNTVIAPAYWELIEPTEGRFDFRSVDALIDAARHSGLRVVLLWFGSWKNSMSSYVPAWVKQNQTRFPRAESPRGRGQEILAPFDSANWQADARAFAALMRHLRAVDGDRHTVILVQVENEIGMIPEARDRSARADSLHAGEVPAELLTYMKAHRETLSPELASLWAKQGNQTAGSWQGVFGQGVGTEELFMAWWFARYANRVAMAGKAAFPLPTYVNAALIRPGYLPGQYVSAGPLPHLIDVWRAGAPAIDFLSPDIYFRNFKEWADRYARSGNPLFIPEATLGAQSATNAFYAFGARNAIGFSPFSIESIADPSGHPLAKSFAMLRQLGPLILAHQGMGTMSAAIPAVTFDGVADTASQRLSLTGAAYVPEISFERPRRGSTEPPSGGRSVEFGDVGRNDRTPGSGALVIALAPDEFLIAGTGVTVRFHAVGVDSIAGILTAESGTFENGTWRPRLRLNGDQTNQGRNLHFESGEFALQRVRLYRFR